MHDIKWIRENPEAFDQGLTRRGLEPRSKELLSFDATRRHSIAEAQRLQERRNTASKEIAIAMKAGDSSRVDSLKTEVANLKNELAARELEERTIIDRLNKLLLEIPNIPLLEVPFGKDENDNPELRTVGRKPQFSFQPKEHFEIGEALGLMDFDTAAKLSGARFVVLKGALARLERALSQFMLDLHTGEHGYAEINPPILVRDDAMFGTAQLPKFEEDQFQTKMRIFSTDQVKIELTTPHNPTITDKHLEKEFLKLKQNNPSLGWALNFRHDKPPLLTVDQRMWLIPTAEVPLTNLVREKILDEKDLPIRVTASTPCFRAEAGAAGRDTRGMIRQHQFPKVELVSVTTPEQSLAEHERLLNCAEEVLKRLGLAYRVVTLCTGDMGFASQKTYDIEVWLPGQGRYREISSCSVCGDFQARRMDTRYRPEGGKTTRFVHTLNGSGVAVGRALVAVLENYQNEDGSVTVPDVLLPYMGGITRLTKAA
jgi:seryl-tRNA synthetase